MKKYLIIVVVLSWAHLALAQEMILGIVYADVEFGKPQPLIGASVAWQNTTVGVLTNAKGQFKIQRHASVDSLVVSYVGYKTQTVFVGMNDWELMISLESDELLNGITIQERARTSGVSTDDTELLIKINSGELKKAACCNLSESFETNPSVDVSFSDAITGSKKIKMLGLDGIYSLITVENIPNVRGLSSSFGINSIPGSWIQSIQLAKGIGSVVNGYESITGQINVELKKPSVAPSYSVNVYANQLGRFEVTADHNIKLNKKWSTGLMVHGSNYSFPIDANSDGFMDLPLSNQINIANRWQYYNGKMESLLSASFLTENRTSGDMKFSRDKPISINNPYGVIIDQTRFDLHVKGGIVPPEDHENRSLGIIGNYTYYTQNAVYGLKEYFGKQQYGYLNVIFQDQLLNRYNLIKTGVSLVADDYYENFNDQLNSTDTLLTRTELVAGAFAEYTYHPNVRLSVIAGMRLDYHNMFGLIPTPRFHFRYKLRKNLTFRFASGTGFRYPNVLVDNTRTMVSSKLVVFDSAIKPERAINTGASLVWDYKINGHEGGFNVDVFRTQFINQVIMDMDADPYKLLFYNLDGKSFANVFQIDGRYDIKKNLELKLSYKWQDVRATINDELQRKPFVARNKMFANLAYENKSNKWKFDITALRTDQARLPNSKGRPVEFQWAQQSEAFYTVNGQITRDFGQLEIYVGGENLTNFTQKNPIVSVDSPFSPEFDAANVWAPIFGRMIYAGLRFSFI